jgi:hypothetical protein
MKALIALLGCAFLCNADEVLTRDERVIALTILGEARGEGKVGMFAVACVIQRRHWEKKKTPAQICLQKEQFDIWNGVDRQGNYRLKKERELYYLWDSKEMMYARYLARCLDRHFFGGGNRGVTLVDITNGANHYCTLKSNPYWAKGKKPTKIIGNHKFYKLP